MARREAIPTEARGDPDRGERKVHSGSSVMESRERRRPVAGSQRGGGPAALGGRLTPLLPMPFARRWHGGEEVGRHRQQRRWRRQQQRIAARSDIGGSNRSSRGSNSSSSSGAAALLETAEGVSLSDQVQAEAMLRAFGEDVALHTETALLQEEEGSTFFISDILKLVIAPFVAVMLDPIAGPAMRKGSDMLSGSGAAGPIAGFIAKFIGAIIALILGMIVAISVSQAVGEAVIYHCSWQTVDYVGRFVSSAVVETAVNDLNECAAAQFGRAQFGRAIHAIL